MAKINKWDGATFDWITTFEKPELSKTIFP